MCRCATYLQSVHVSEVRQKRQFIIAKVVINWEGDLLVDHVYAIVVGKSAGSPVEQVLRNVDSLVVAILCRPDTHSIPFPHQPPFEVLPLSCDSVRRKKVRQDLKRVESVFIGP